MNAGPDDRLPTLPFMPVLNATQVFWTHPRAITSESAAGIEYYTYYSVVPEPILDGQVMYAYQAITVNGEYYLSFSMPAETALLQTTLPENLDLEAFVADYSMYIQGVFDFVNSANPATFNPTPDELTQFIESISFVEQPAS